MRFEDLEVWQQSVQLSVQIYKETADINDFGFSNQITRSALSIPSNIAEGFDRDHNKETIHFLSIAKGACAELRTQIIIGQRSGFLNSNVAEQAKNQTLEITTMLKALIRTRKTFNN